MIFFPLRLGPASKPHKGINKNFKSTLWILTSNIITWLHPSLHSTELALNNTLFPKSQLHPQRMKIHHPREDSKECAASSEGSSEGCPSIFWTVAMPSEQELSLPWGRSLMVISSSLSYILLYRWIVWNGTYISIMWSFKSTLLGC